MVPPENARKNAKNKNLSFFTGMLVFLRNLGVEKI